MALRFWDVMDSKTPYWTNVFASIEKTFFSSELLKRLGRFYILFICLNDNFFSLTLLASVHATLFVWWKLISHKLILGYYYMYSVHDATVTWQINSADFVDKNIQFCDNMYYTKLHLQARSPISGCIRLYRLLTYDQINKFDFF